VSTRRGASKGRATPKRRPAKTSRRGKSGRGRPQQGRAGRRRRTLILLGIALAGAAALLWGVVRIGNPPPAQFRLSPPGDGGASGGIEIEEGEREELRSLIDELGKDAAK